MEGRNFFTKYSPPDVFVFLKVAYHASHYDTLLTDAGRFSSPNVWWRVASFNGDIFVTSSWNSAARTLLPPHPTIPEEFSILEVVLNLVRRSHDVSLKSRFRIGLFYKPYAELLSSGYFKFFFVFFFCFRNSIRGAKYIFRLLMQMRRFLFNFL